MCGTFASAPAWSTTYAGIGACPQSALAPTEVLREPPTAQHTPITRRSAINHVRMQFVTLAAIDPAN
jgi:hypothetical protein